MSVKVIIGSQNILTENISITKTINALCDSFNFSLPNTQLNLNEKVQILINDNNIMNGYINQINHATPSNNNTLSLVGRSMSQDIIDSRITHVAQNKTLEELSADLFKKFNQSFTTEIETQPVKDFSIVAESAFEALNQIAKQQNLLYIENPNGSVTLVNPANVDNTHIHLNPGNLSDFNISEDTSQFFHTTTVKTNPGKDNLDANTHNNYSHTLQIKSVRPSRIKELIADKLTNQQACKDRAHELITTAKSQGLSASGSSPGWLDPLGKIWKPNSLYTVNTRPMLLASATFNETGRNRTTQLQFKGHG